MEWGATLCELCLLKDQPNKQVDDPLDKRSLVYTNRAKNIWMPGKERELRRSRPSPRYTIFHSNTRPVYEVCIRHYSGCPSTGFPHETLKLKRYRHIALCVFSNTISSPKKYRHVTQTFVAILHCLCFENKITLFLNKGVPPSCLIRYNYILQLV